MLLPQRPPDPRERLLVLLQRLGRLAQPRLRLHSLVRAVKLALRPVPVPAIIIALVGAKLVVALGQLGVRDAAAVLPHHLVRRQELGLLRGEAHPVAVSGPLRVPLGIEHHNGVAALLQSQRCQHARDEGLHQRRIHLVGAPGVCRVHRAAEQAQRALKRLRHAGAQLVRVAGEVVVHVTGHRGAGGRVPAAAQAILLAAELRLRDVDVRHHVIQILKPVRHLLRLEVHPIVAIP
mmetsp:Transcript_22923/g.58798  ORF Transcript_22923/g.58798 Transcript_22923/m.58798 type:complete len:235 (+) Transcript_22923:1071-1775(+)